MKHNTQKPYLKCNNHVIIDVNCEFTCLTGYAREEFVGVTLEQAGRLLRTFDQVQLTAVAGSFQAYIFTKELEPVKTTIKVVEGENGIKTFLFLRHSSSMINERFGFADQFYTDRQTRVCMIAYPGQILLKANDNYFRLEKYPDVEKLRDYNVGRKQLFHMLEDRYPSMEVFYRQLVEGNKPFHAEEYEYIDENGVTYWNISIVPMCVDGVVEYFIQAKLDVTEKVMARRQLEKQESIIRNQKDELETIIENISESLIIYDRDGHPTKINRAARALISCSEESVDCEDPLEACSHTEQTGEMLPEAYRNKEETWDEGYRKEKKCKRALVHCFKKLQFYSLKGEPLSHKESPINRVAAGETIEDLHLQIRVNGETRIMEINGTPVFDEQGTFRTGILSCHDITERTKVQEMLYVKSQYDILNKIIENMDMAVLRLSYPDLKVNDLNQKVLRRIVKINSGINGIEDVRGKDMQQVFIPEFTKEIYDDISRLVGEGKTTLVSNMQRMVENEERHSKFIYQPVKGFNDEIVEIAIIGVDVTQEVKARCQIEHNMKMQEELFSNISHELKTPINVIFSLAQLFEYYVSNDLISVNMDKVAGGIQTMKQNCYRLTKLIGNIIDMSKLETGFMSLNLKNQNIVSVTEDIVQSVAEYVKEMGRHIVFDANVEEKIIACDSDKIERILLNLISNSVKFTEEGDEIFVEVEVLEEAVQISVSDKGIGIEPCKLDMIFDRYRQIEECGVRNHEGSGIGLSLVKSIVQLHGGTIEAESELGNGSVFRITLPAILVADDVDEIAATFTTTAAEEAFFQKNTMINIEFSDLKQLHNSK